VPLGPANERQPQLVCGGAGWNDVVQVWCNLAPLNVLMESLEMNGTGPEMIGK